MSGYGSSCGACKFLRRKCSNACIFAPHFCYEQGATHFAAIHKVFGASNVSKLLSHLPMQNRWEAALTISYEAQARMRDPVYGCVAHIFALQQQVACLQKEIELLATQMVHPAEDVTLATRMASLQEEIECHGIPQAMNNFNDFQFSSQTDSMNLGDFFSPDNLHPTHVVNANDARATFDGKINQLLPFDRQAADRWDHCLFNDFANEPRSLERLPLGMEDQGILPSDPWFANGIYYEY